MTLIIAFDPRKPASLAESGCARQELTLRVNVIERTLCG